VAVNSNAFRNGDLSHAAAQQGVKAAGRILRHGAQHDEMPSALPPVILPPLVHDDPGDAG